MAEMNRPAPVEMSYKHMRFLITHNPANATLSTFIEDLKKYGATTVVCVCEVTYDKVLAGGWHHSCGDAPLPGKVVEDWLSLVKAKFCEALGSCMAVHCVAGLGRKRRGAINSKQLTYLEKYRPKQRLRFKDPHTHKTRCCVM
uniref:Protein tyrosine phosphatase type IVA 3 n=1 Tax=Aotus nancymaae TaxID=37293 RepID=A0A2K5CBT6_AOTNA